MSEVIKDASGRPIGKIVTEVDGTIKVYDDLGLPKGKVTEDGTFDDLGIKISSAQVPGLLLD